MYLALGSKLLFWPSKGVWLLAFLSVSLTPGLIVIPLYSFLFIECNSLKHPKINHKLFMNVWMRGVNK